MKKLKYFVIFSVFLTSFASIFIYREAALSGARRGVELCANVIIPSLFAAICICNILIKTDFVDKVAHRCKAPSRIILNQNGYALPVLLLSLISGYPVGASMANSLFDRGVINRRQRDRMTLTCCGAGPSFVLFAVGVSMLGSFNAGVVLLISHISAAILNAVIVSALFPRGDYKITVKKYTAAKSSISEALVEGVSGATTTMMSICAFTILFSVAASVLSSLLHKTPLFLPVIGVLEVTNAVMALRGARVSLPLISAALSFGGLSVICQIAARVAAPRVSLPKILAARALNAIVAFLVTTVVLMFYRLPEPVLKTVDTVGRATSQNLYFSLALLAFSVVFIAGVFKIRNRPLAEIFKM